MFWPFIPCPSLSSSGQAEDDSDGYLLKGLEHQTPEEMGAFLATDLEGYGAIIKAADTKL